MISEKSGSAHHWRHFAYRSFVSVDAPVPGPIPHCLAAPSPDQRHLVTGMTSIFTLVLLKPCTMVLLARIPTEIWSLNFILPIIRRQLGTIGSRSSSMKIHQASFDSSTFKRLMQVHQRRSVHRVS